jgi:hypothetical protein
MKLLVTVSIAVFSFLFNSKTKNFSGSWKLNDEMSEYGIIPKEKAPFQYTIELGGDTMTITRVSSEKNESGVYKTYSEMLVANTWTTTVREFDGVIKKSLVKWVSNEQFIISSHYFLPDDESNAAMISEETWSLTEKGKYCTVIAEVSIGENSGKVKWFFERND